MRAAGRVLPSVLIPLACSLALGCGREEPAPAAALAAVVRPEHPRPDLRRDTFVNLNTVWELAYDPDDVGVAERWFDEGAPFPERIQVPFAWESPLGGLVPAADPDWSPTYTGVAHTYRGVAWYRLRLPDPLPAAAAASWHLVFGAVDYAATVYVNGREVGHHEGGYDPFSVDLAGAVAPGEPATIVVRAEDWTDAKDRSQPVGKQGGTWYTRTSGIWQTVYLEQRPATWIDGFAARSSAADRTLRITPRLQGDASGTLSLEARLAGQLAGSAHASVVAGASTEIVLPLDPYVPWDTDAPTLYDLDLRFSSDAGAEDVVHSYFGLVEIGTDWIPGHAPSDGVDPHEQWKSLRVNGRPRYLRCVLDQSYYPGGVYTAPSLDAIRADLQTVRDLGFDCVRLHIKLDEPVKYRLMDELGLLVVQDLPALDLQSRNVEGFAGRAKYETMLRRGIARDQGHPSLAAWVTFNENWGLMEHGSVLTPQALGDEPEMQAWVREMVALARSLDPTRPVEDNSAGGIVGKLEHVDTDLDSFHWYGADAAAYRAFLDEQSSQTFPGSPARFVGGALQDGAPFWNSEFASFSTVGGGAGPQIFCDLFGLINEMRRVPSLTGYVLTQLTDVEYERNGLVGYHRDAKDLCARHGVSLADVTGADFVAFDWLPGATVPAGATVDVPLRLSSWSSDASRSVRVRLRWDEGNPTELSATVAPYAITPIVATLPRPATGGATTLVAELVDGGERRLAANRIELVAGP